MEDKVVLSVSNITKTFGIVKALNQVSIDFRSGEIHGLIGENGSGKSTMASVITGVYRAEDGTMALDGQPYQPESVLDAAGQGICMIVQEMGTIDGISVAANVFAGKENLFAHLGIVRKKEMIRAAQNILDEIGASDIRAENPIGGESFENRKIVEIARAMYEDVKVMIVDETTTALSQKGREILYRLMSRLKDEGKTIIFISHDLDELTQLCDSVTILRDGNFVRDLKKEEITPDVMRKHMVGRDVQDDYYRTDQQKALTDQVVLEVEHVSSSLLKDISLNLKKGEILGIGGLTDCGMHELGKVIFGIQAPKKGNVYAGEKRIRIRNPRTAIRQKIGYVSKNRDQESIMKLSNIRDNICLPSYDKIKKGCYVSPKAEETLAGRESNKLSIKMSSLDQLCIQLSGGNKQKVALAKWLGNDSDLLILDCPTRGIDVGVKAAIYQLMNQYKQSGKSILMISEELQELIGMSDRILILKEGALSGTFDRSPDLTENDLIQYMI